MNEFKENIETPEENIFCKIGDTSISCSEAFFIVLPFLAWSLFIWYKNYK